MHPMDDVGYVVLSFTFLLVAVCSVAVITLTIRSYIKEREAVGAAAAVVTTAAEAVPPPPDTTENEAVCDEVTVIEGVFIRQPDESMVVAKVM